MRSVGSMHRTVRSGIAPVAPLPEVRVTPDTVAPPPGYVCFSAQDWWYHNRAHSDIQLMRRVAAHRRVLFVNSIAMRMPLPGRSARVTRRLLRKAKSMARSLRQPVDDLPGFWVFTPVLLPLYGSPLGRRINSGLIRRQVSWAARRAGITTDPVYFVTVPTAWDVVGRLPRRALVFNRSDKHSTFREADQSSIAALESELLRHADHVVYVSHALMDEDAPVVGDRATFLDHGVDLDHFVRRSPDEEPEDLRSIPHPRVGFFGGLDDYLVDFDLLHRLATELPEAHVVLVGDASTSMRRFEHLPNVHWLGFRPYEVIPRYGSGFDVALMPWLRTEWIAYSNPIKLKEYLALGLPVVTTDFSEAHRYRALLRIASNADDFVAHVRRALDDPPSDTDRDRRRAAVADASWERRAAELLERCESPTPRPR